MRGCEMAGCDRRDATARSACGIFYICPPCWEQVEQLTAIYQAEDAAAEPEVLDLIRPSEAAQMLATRLQVTEVRASALLSTSGIPTQQMSGRTVMHRADITAYTRHLPQQTRQVPIGGGPAIGYAAERDYQAEQDDQ
jgi:hypothetical protein